MIPLGMNRGPGGGGDFVTEIKNWWANLPLFSKLVCYISIGSWVLGSLLGMFGLFINTPGTTFLSFQIWRLFTSPFAIASIFDILFSGLAYLPMLTKQEREEGSMKTIVDFFAKNLEIIVAFNLILVVISFIIPSFANVPSFGLWNIFLFNLVEACLFNNPEGEMQFMCLPIMIKGKYYPIALVVFFNLLGILLGSSTIRLDLPFSVGLGYAHVYYFNEHYKGYFNSSRISGWENLSLFSSLKTYPNYVGPNGSVSGTTSTGFGQPYMQGDARPQASNQPNNNPFSGRGVAIGGNDTNNLQKPKGVNDVYAILDEGDDDLENNNRP